MKKIKAGIVGGAGYTGGELIRLLINHANAEIAFVQSTSNAGNLISDIHHDLLGDTVMRFTDEPDNSADVLFLCSGHGAARKFLEENHIPASTVIIDLSQDFRHSATRTLAERKFTYGLPELNRNDITTTKSIANPGCFATAIQLALLPLAANSLLHDDVHVNATTGSTGSGQALSATTHFTWRDSNVSVYKALEHQHLTEITESVISLQPSFEGAINFIPQRGNFTRGILASVYTKCQLTLEEVTERYQEYYKSHPFIRISPKAIDVKLAVNTNRCFLHIEKHNDLVLITAAIDNLLKGASGQAVQNMNLIFGLDETTGLHLKPSAF